MSSVSSRIWTLVALSISYKDIIIPLLIVICLHSYINQSNRIEGGSLRGVTAKALNYDHQLREFEL